MLSLIIKMSVKDMDFEGHPAAHGAVVLHQSLNQLHIVFGLVIAQEAPNYCDKAVPSHFLHPSDFLGNSLHSMIFFICGPTKTPALTFSSDSLGKKS